MKTEEPSFSDEVRLDRIGAGVERRLEPDAAARARIAAALELAELSAFAADLKLAPAGQGWRLTGKVVADAVQLCGLTLQPLPVHIEAPVDVSIIEGEPRDEDEIDIDIELDDNAPDVVDNGRIDLGAYAVEHLALALDPYPRAPGAEFVQPPEPAEVSPFAALAKLKPSDGDKS